jgi:hypothetical protein
MDSPNSDAVPPDASSAHRFEVALFKPDGGASHAGALLTLGIAVTSAAVLGALASLIGQGFHLVFFFAIAVGLGVGACVSFALKQGKVRDPSIGIMAGAAAGVVAMSTMHYCDYRHFLSKLEDEARGSGDTFAQRSGFAGYMRAQAEAGITITRSNRNEKGFNLGFGGTIFYWLVEVGIVLGLVVFMGHTGASKPFCVPCDQWKQERVLKVLHTSPQMAANAVEKGRAVGLVEKETLSSGSGEKCLLKGYVCPHCGADGEVEIALVHEKFTEKGEKQAQELTKVTYPGAVLAAIAAVGAEG